MNFESGVLEADAEPVAAGQAPARRRRWLLILGIVLAVAAIAAWFFRPQEAAPVGAGEGASQAPTVSVTVPGRVTVPRLISATGTIAARRELPVGVAGEGGQVTRVLVDNGDWVRAGQVLAVIDRAVQGQQAAQAAANIRVAEADARLAQANLDRALQLVERGFVSRADVDRLTATRDAARARVNVARATLGELDARTRRLNIVAPAAGLVLERNVEPGQVVGAGSGVLFRIAQGGELELRAQLSETDLASVSTGVTARVRPVGTQREFTGSIWQVEPVIDPQTRQGIARVALGYDPALRPGGFASAEIASGATVAPLLPESAILSDDQGSFVYVVGPDGKVARRPVRTGTISASGIAIAEGLTGNEQVVLRAGGFLNPGETVKARRVTRPAGAAAPTAAG